MRWLRRFLSTDDPIVKLIAALTEPEAQMRQELLMNEGVAAMVKNTGMLQSHLQLPFARDYDLYVKKSDGERAVEILGPLIDAEPSEDAPSEGNGSGDGYVR